MGDAGIQDISKRSDLPKVLIKVEEKFRLDLTGEQFVLIVFIVWIVWIVRIVWVVWIVLIVLIEWIKLSVWIVLITMVLCSQFLHRNVNTMRGT